MNERQELFLIETAISNFNEKVDLVKNVLKQEFLPASTRYNKKRVGLAITLDDRHQPTEEYKTREQLYDYLEAHDKCRNMFSSDEERKEILNKAIDDWYTKKD